MSTEFVGVNIKDIQWGYFKKCLINKRFDVCLQTITSFRVGAAEVAFLSKDHKPMIETIVRLCLKKPYSFPDDEDFDMFLKAARRFLVNFAANEDGCIFLGAMFEELEDERLVDRLIKLSFTNCSVAMPFAQLMSNITRLEPGRNIVVKKILASRELMNFSIKVSFLNYRKKTAVYSLHILANLCVNPDFQEALMGMSNFPLMKILPVLKHSEDDFEVEAILALLKNLSMVHDNHFVLLQKCGILPFILYHIAGPEEYTEDEMNDLPSDLQYLPANKKRTTDRGQRIILETLLQFCSTRECRRFLRCNGTYLVLREYHKWTTEKDMGDLCNVVSNYLTKSEEELAAEANKDDDSEDFAEDEAEDGDDDDYEL